MNRRGFLKQALLSAAFVAVSQVMPLGQKSFEPAVDPYTPRPLVGQRADYIILDDPDDGSDGLTYIAREMGYPPGAQVVFRVVNATTLEAIYYESAKVRWLSTSWQA